MSVAIIGIPNGFELRAKKLQEYVKSGIISKYEILSDQSSIVIYWTGMAPKQSISLILDGHSMIPGKFKAPASRFYLYYSDEFKKWNDGLSIEITQK